MNLIAPRVVKAREQFRFGSELERAGLITSRQLRRPAQDFSKSIDYSKPRWIFEGWEFTANKHRLPDILPAGTTRVMECVAQVNTSGQGLHNVYFYLDRDADGEEFYGYEYL